MLNDRLRAGALEVAERCATPFYLFDLERLGAGYREMERVWRREFPNLTVAYSYKTNPLAAATRRLAALGGTAEVVSGAELSLALSDGFAPGRIVFDGPVKSPAELALAARLGVPVQVDSLTELDDLLALPDGPPPVGLRLATRGGDGEWSRFGLVPDEVARARELLDRADRPVWGVHAGVGTLSGPDAYREALVFWAETLRDLAKAAGGRLTVDVGGGFPPRGVPGREWEVYAAAVAAGCREAGLRPEELDLLIEPGRSLVEEHGALVCRVAVRKSRDGRELLVLDGGTNLARTVKSRAHPIEFPAAPGDLGGRYRLLGANCYEGDVFADDVAGPAGAAPGDVVVIGGAGGYDQPFAHLWVRPRPPVHALDGDGWTVVRERGDTIR
nr:diaminopimelate decarboxylase [Kitasatospora sp. Xyl93]